MFVSLVILVLRCWLQTCWHWVFCWPIYQEYKGDVYLASNMLLKVANLPTDRSFQQESTTNQMLDKEHFKTRVSTVTMYLFEGQNVPIMWWERIVEKSWRVESHKRREQNCQKFLSMTEILASTIFRIADIVYRKLAVLPFMKSFTLLADCRVLWLQWRLKVLIACFWRLRQVESIEKRSHRGYEIKSFNGFCHCFADFA